MKKEVAVSSFEIRSRTVFDELGVAFLLSSVYAPTGMGKKAEFHAVPEVSAHQPLSDCNGEAWDTDRLRFTLPHCPASLAGRSCWWDVPSASLPCYLPTSDPRKKIFGFLFELHLLKFPFFFFFCPLDARPVAPLLFSQVYHRNCPWHASFEYLFSCKPGTHWAFLNCFDLYHVAGRKRIENIWTRQSISEWFWSNLLSVTFNQVNQSWGPLKKKKKKLSAVFCSNLNVKMPSNSDGSHICWCFNIVLCNLLFTGSLQQPIPAFHHN